MVHHSHACGEYSGAAMPKSTLPRFTPTRVGNTIPNLQASCRVPVHPHACGEYIRSSVGTKNSVRFTPTRVGNTWLDPQVAVKHPVHPHACGEYMAIFDQDSSTGGSPPRVWGIPCCGQVSQSRGRFTPTRVGNTYVTASTVTRSSGSPPRVWGIRKSFPVFPKPKRFTPTRVGNTRIGISAPPMVSVHPHACGEYARQVRRQMNGYGSPPRVWGIRGLCYFL